MNRRELMMIAAAAAAGTAAAGASSDAARAEGDRMILRRIPSSGEELPVIGLGTSGPMEVGTGAAARAPLKEVIDAFFEGGGRLIDTSPMYSTAERVLGELLSPEQQKRCFMATKVWTDGAAAGVAQMGESARLLKHQPLDLIQVHNLRDLDAQLATLRAWKAEGKVRYLGITHYTVSAHDDLARVIEREKPDFVQLNYSALTRDAERRLLPLAADRGVAVIVNRAFEDGQVFARLKGVPVPAWAADFDATSWAQLLLKYVIAHPAVTCVIPATGKARNMRDNLAAGRGRLPDAAQRQRIVEAVSA
ncbi:MAG: aldo/keto reductase [Steroidobacteraceae bacterium]|nr:aldo/keto reductase [Steroidobacteraceae bacterium]